MAPSVNVTNISPKTTEVGLRKFFTFCGTVTNVDLHAGSEKTQNATVFFEDNEAADTAAMLDGTDLDEVPISVTRVDAALEAAGSTTPKEYGSEADVPQEHKPRRRILAEMLAQGYHVTDQVIAKVLEMDKKRGFSTHLDKFLKNLEDRIRPREQARDIDAKYNVSSQISGLASSWKTYLTPYYESAAKTPTGTRLRDFYNSTIDSAQQVHNEAMWIKKNQIQKKGCQCQSETKEACTCAPGSCKCAEAKAESSDHACPCGSSCACAKGEPTVAGCSCSARKGTEKDCGCGAQSADCPCPEDACACDNCPKQKKGGDSTCKDCTCTCQGDASKCTCTCTCKCEGGSCTCSCPTEKCACKSSQSSDNKELYQ